MTFVFEACELPFDAVTDAYASRIGDLVSAFDLHHLPLWDRCMLAAVLPFVAERRHAVTNAVSASLAPPPPPLSTHDTAQDVREGRPSTVAADGGDVADATENRESSPQPITSTLTDDVTSSDIEVALTIVGQLDELEVVYDSIVAARAEQQEGQQAGNAPAAASSSPSAQSSANGPKKTSEEILMEQLLQERFSETAPYLPDSDDESGERASAQDVVDVAMSFTTRGESLGIGSAAVFGGHGYHP